MPSDADSTSTRLGVNGLPVYSNVTLPDGTESPVVQLSDGSWEFVATRLRQEREFSARFSNTVYRPHPMDASDRETLTPKEVASRTRCHVEAYLVESLGDPALITKRDADALARVASLRALPDVLRHVVGLTRVLNDRTWNSVRDGFLV